MRYDAAVIGSGPAGLEAAVNLKIRNKSFLLFGPEAMSRKLLAAPRIDNYLGLPAISGKELQAKFQLHLKQMGIEICARQIQMVYPMGDYFALASSKETYEATTVILAPGIAAAAEIPGESRFLGKGVGYCATCDAPLFRGKTVAVLGYSDEAVYEADFVAELAGRVYYVPMKQQGLPPGNQKVEVLSGGVTAIEGDGVVRAILLDGKSVAVDGVFILRDTVAPGALVTGLATRDGFVEVNADMETNLPGCFAAGDCTGKPHQYMRAAGQGQTAALSAVHYLDKMHAKERKRNDA